MIAIVLIIQNPKEAVFLRQIFLKVNIKIISAAPSYASYIKTLQYDPDLVIMEIPEDPKAHLQFLRIIRNNKAIDQKPFILYGASADEQNVKSMYEAGADVFIARPLEIRALIDKIRDLVRSKSKRKYNVEEKNQLSEDERIKLTDPTFSRSEKKEIMRRHISKLMAFPATVASILKVSQNEKSGAGELAKVIQSDPAMSAEILKIANSVYFSRGGRRILDIKDAVVRIGFIQTKKIAMSISVFKISRDQNYATGFNHNDYWFHCLAVAIIAQTIAKNSQLVIQEEAFIGGLLHDLGTLLFNEYFNDLFLKVLERSTDEGTRFIECEEELLGFNHNDLISELFTEWKFPEVLCEDIKIICRSISLTPQFVNEHKLASIVTVADIIAKSFQIGRSVDCCIEPISREVMEVFRYPYGIQQAFLEKVYSELNMYNEVLKIDKRVFPIPCTHLKIAPEIVLICHSFTDEVFIPVYEYLKNQGYQITLSRSVEDLSCKCKSAHAAILTGVDKTREEELRLLSRIKMIPFCQKQVSDEDYMSTDKKSCRQPDSAKMLLLVLDSEFLKRQHPSGIVSSMYSIDLRTIDIALHCLLFNLSTDQLLNAKGSLALQKAADSLKISLEKRCILIGHFKSEFRDKLKECFNPTLGYSIEEANEGPKLVNLARTMKDELHLIVLDLNIPLLSCVEVIKSIKELPKHRRVRFVVTFANCEKAQLVPLVKLGVRDFINEESSPEQIQKKFQEMGF